MTIDIELSPEAAKRVIRLNACLHNEARWIEERARRTLSAYVKGNFGVAAPWDEQGTMCVPWEDFELNAIVKCSLADDDPAFNPDSEYDNLIAFVEADQKYLTYDRDGLNWTDCDVLEGSPDRWSEWGEGLPHIEAFQGAPICYLFHEIFRHTLRGDLDALLRIGEIEINLMMTRQSGFALEAAQPPGKRKDSYPRSVFGRTHYTPQEPPLTYQELRYARLLNQKLGEAQTWIAEQARQGEREYLETGGRDCALTADKSYEDYEMMMKVTACLGENHPEYDEDDDNIVASYSEPVSKTNQRVFGRARNAFPRNLYGRYFAHRKNRRGELLDKIAPCGLFWNIYDGLGRDWLKMLSIGQVWLDVFLTQRRVTRI